MEVVPLFSLYCKERCDVLSFQWPLLVGMELTNNSDVEVYSIFPR